MLQSDQNPGRIKWDLPLEAKKKYLGWRVMKFKAESAHLPLQLNFLKITNRDGL